MRAALACRRQLVGDEDGGATLAALPWLAGAPVDIVAREALRLELVLGESALPGSVTLAISARWQERLRVAAGQVDRHALSPTSRAASVAVILDLVRGDWQELLPANSPPRSLGAFAVCLRRLARQWRRHARARKARGGAAADA